MSRGAISAGTLVLDSQGLSLAVQRDRGVTEWLALARADDLRVVVSAATLVEVIHPSVKITALEWTLSRLVVEPVTEALARDAARLLAEVGLHGHRHAIEAMVVATAAASQQPVTILTSDPGDLRRLAGPTVTIIPV